MLKFPYEFEDQVDFRVQKTEGFWKIRKKSEKHKNSAKFQKWQKWSPELPPSIWGHFEWNAGHLSELLAVLAFQTPCKSRIFNFKSTVSQPIAGFQYFRNFQKTRKNTEIQQNFKNVKSELFTFLHRYKVIPSHIEVTCASYCHY